MSKIQDFLESTREHRAVAGVQETTEEQVGAPRDAVKGQVIVCHVYGEVDARRRREHIREAGR